MKIEIQSYRGDALLPFIEEVGKLRIKVFREYPYLYDGSIDYEIAYLKKYSQTPSSITGIARSSGTIIGATTALPLMDADTDFQKPFIDSGYPIEQVFYFGESVILPEFRGQGTGHHFFQLREETALAHRAKMTCFCAVNRPNNHPLRPSNYKSNDAFWARLGYVKKSDMQCSFPWKQVDTNEETANTLTFWIKEWN